MSFFAVLLALALEQLRPLPRRHAIQDALTAWADWTGRNFDAGREHHAWVVWTIATLVPAVAVWLVYFALMHVNVLLGLAWNAAVLYLTLGFRQFSHYFTDIRDALERGDEIEARRLLSQWQRIESADLPRDELLRHVIEQSLLAAHRHVFGVFFWFIVLATLGFGPAGAVLYRMAGFVARHGAKRGATTGVPVNERLAQIARRMFERIDFIPSRMTAFGFAVVGDFEEAIACWRRDAVLWPSSNDGVVLAAAAGAVGVRLGGRAPQVQRPAGPLADFDVAVALEGPEPPPVAAAATPGLTPEFGHLRSVVGLVWRSVVLWMLLLALLTVANLIG
ncbi:MAG TPA: CobD/CbiB family protein [Methylibium sp.]|uniref:CobD/CbiB family protein n=1 Tax=Methylibium sp. TaxID=2067992 RepID=UPI002DBD78B6|nr:CobD/CbiB family protein [Methylibium sp.]HEU4458166.1 CobD/CbiB family protein [Methylibium sp.]